MSAGTPLWLSIPTLFVAIVSILIAIWAATKSAAARNAEEQLRYHLQKVGNEKVLAIASEVRTVDRYEDELILYNLNASPIYIDFAIVDEDSPIDLNTYSGLAITKALKSTEFTRIIRIYDDPMGNVLTLGIRKQNNTTLDLFIFLSSDPGYMHRARIKLTEHTHSAEVERLNSDEYSAIKQAAMAKVLNALTP